MSNHQAQLALPTGKLLSHGNFFLFFKKKSKGIPIWDENFVNARELKIP